jgi:hypothetical protein
MKLADDNKNKPPKNKEPKKNNPKKEEHVDWVDIMGMNKQTLKRGKGGAWK